jgi:hypothetical protein
MSFHEILWYNIYTGKIAKHTIRAGREEGVNVIRLAVYFCAVLGLLCFFTSNLNAERIYQFKVGDRAGEAHRDNATRQFTHCSVEASSENTISLILGMNRKHSLLLVMANPGWDLDKESGHLVNLIIDQKPLGQFAGFSGTGFTIRLTLGNDKEIYEAFREGRVLTVESGYGMFSFNLEGTAESLKKCVETALKFGPGAAGLYGTQTFDARLG